MAETIKKEKWTNWVIRVLIVFDVYLIVSGYLSWYQIKHQLRTPLIPKNTVVQIVEDSQVFEASIVSSVFFLAGVLVYTFNKKIAAIILLCLAPVCHEIIVRYLIF